MWPRSRRTTPVNRRRSLRVATRMGEAALAATSAETAQHSDDVELITGAMCDRACGGPFYCVTGSTPLGTTSTGQAAFRATSADTLPRRTLRIGP